MRRTRVKFCGIVDVRDARDAAAIGADAVGLVFHPPSPRALDPVHAAGIRRALPSWVSVVGLFVNLPPPRVRTIAAAVGLDVLQFHGDESPAVCAEAARRAGLPWWRAQRVGDGDGLLESLASYRDAEAVLLDADSKAYGGSGESFDWSVVPSGYDRPIVLAGGLTAETVGAGIERLAPMAVDVSSGVEALDADGRPLRGIKDAERIRRFVAAVRTAGLA